MKNRFSFTNIDNNQFAQNEIFELYIQTALWSSTDDDGTPLDKKYSINDLAAETLEQAKRDMAKFFEQAGGLLNNYAHNTAAHDFWLTRNRHGAGFWDGDYEKSIGEKLTKLAYSFGEINLYVGDDGKIYGDK